MTKIWCAVLMPGFLPVRLLCVRTEAPAIHRTVLEAPIFKEGARRMLSTDLDSDPLEATFRTVPLLAKEGSGFLDGITYSLAFETPEFRARMHFSNPTHPHLRAIELALISVVRTVLEKDASPEAASLIVELERYSQPRVKGPH